MWLRAPGEMGHLWLLPWTYEMELSEGICILHWSNEKGVKKISKTHSQTPRNSFLLRSTNPFCRIFVTELENSKKLCGVIQFISYFQIITKDFNELLPAPADMYWDEIQTIAIFRACIISKYAWVISSNVSPTSATQLIPNLNPSCYLFKPFIFFAISEDVGEKQISFSGLFSQCVS